MIYVFENGRILYDKTLLIPSDSGKYIEVESLPEITPVEGKVGAINGCNLITKEIFIEYFDIIPIPTPPEPTPIIPPPPPTPEDILSATNTAKLNEILLLLKGVM